MTVRASEDADGAVDEATVEHTVSGGDYGSETASDVAVTVTENETASMGVTLRASPLTVDEDAGATMVTVTAELDAAPRAVATVVTVSVGAGGDSAAAGTDYGSVDDFTVTIPAGATSETGSFELTPVNDAVDEDAETVTVGGSATGLTVTGTEITITDDDTRRVAVSPTSVTVPEGGSATYTVVLQSAPTDTVTVTPRVNGSPDVSVSPSSLDFDASDWETAQTVTVSASEDADGAVDEATVEHTVSGGDYGSETASDVAVTVTENETASMGVTLTASPVTVAEDAVTTTVTVTAKLDAAPRAVATVVTVSVGAGGDSAAAGTDYGSVDDFTVTIPAGATSETGSFELTPVNDAVDEDAETVTVGGSATGLTVTGGELTITDDDTRGVEVSPTAVTVPEGGSADYTVVLRSSPTGPVTVTPEIRGSGDVTVTPSSLEFSSSDWDTAQTVTVRASEDDDGAVDEATVEHTVSGGDYGSETAPDVAVTVAENETASTTVTLTAEPGSVDEDAGATPVMVTAELDAAPRAVATVVTVSVGAGGDSAVAGTDYGSVADFTVRIPAGSTSGSETFTLTPVNDAVDEDAETVTVGGSATGLTVTGTAVAITDDDTRGVEVSPTAVTVPEGGSADYTVVLRSSPTGPVTVTPEIRGSGDVTVTPSSLEFSSSDWDTAQTVTVRASEDDDGAVDEATVEHTVSGGDYGSETAPDVAVTVAENETASTTVTLTAEPGSVDEDAGATPVMVTAELDAAPRAVATVVTVSVGAGGDSAVAGTDYGSVADFTVTIPADATSETGSFELTPVNDAVDEDAETVTVGGSVTGLTVTGTEITITDDDTRRVAVSPTSVTVPEGGSATYTVVLQSAPTDTVTVTPRVNGSPDVSVSPSSLDFDASDWETAQTVTVSASEDADGAVDEATVEHTVSGGDYGSETASDVAVTVTENETASTGVTLTASPLTVDEDAGATMVTVTAELDAAPRAVATVVTVSVGANGDSAEAGTDYGSVSDFTVTIPADAPSETGSFELTPVDDAVDEDAEELSIEGSVSGLEVIGTAVTIADDDTASIEVTLTASPATVDEDAGTVTVTVTAELDAAPRAVATVVTVSVGANGDSATAGTDYGSVSDFTVTIPADAASETESFELTPVNDAVAEGAEEFSIEGSVSGLEVIGTAVTIADDDTASTGVTLTASPVTVDEDAGATTVTVTAELDAAPRAVATVVTVSVGANGDSAEAGTDYGSVSDFTVTIPADAPSETGSFELTPVDDAVDEDAEELSIEGSVSGLEVIGTAVTIADDDTASIEVTLTASPATVDEDAGTVTVTVTAELDAAPRAVATVVTVSVGANGDSATAGTDYGSVSDFTVTIPADAASETESFELTPVNDAVAEGAEEFSIEGSVSGLEVIGTAVTIADDDTASTGVTLTASPVTVDEDAGATTVTVTAELDAAPRAVATVVTVSVGANGDSAEAGTDYGSVSDFTVTIPADAMRGSESFELTPVNDGLAEGDEELSIEGSVPGLDVIGAELMITDGSTSDNAVKLSVTPSSVSEGAGATEIEVMAELERGPRSAPTPVMIRIERNDDEYHRDPGEFEIMIPAEKVRAAGMFMLTPVADAEPEEDEEVSVTGTNGHFAVTGTVLRIRDDEALGERHYTFRLAENRSGRGRPIFLGSITPSDSNGGPMRYDLVRGNGRFAVGNASGSVTYVGPGENFESRPSEYELFVEMFDDQDVLRDRVWVTVIVTDVPEAPMAWEDRIETPEDTPVTIDVLSNDRDPDGDTLRVTSFDNPEHGELSVGSGGLRYVPELNWHGTDGFRYTVSDPGGLTATAAVEITVTPVNDPPEAKDDWVETLEDRPTWVAVLANDTDVDGDRLRVVSVGSAAHGETVILEGGAGVAYSPEPKLSVGSGDLRYVPELNWHGTDGFRYTVSDPGGLTATAAVEITVTPVNDPPEAKDDWVETLEDQPTWVAVLANDTDVDGDRLRVVSVGSAAHGETVILEGGAGVAYSPEPNWHGTDGFTYAVADPEGLTSGAAVTVVVLSVNDAPEAVGRIPAQRLEEGGDSLDVELAPYFSDVDGDRLTYTAVSSNEQVATVGVSGATLTLTPVVTGAASVTVTAADSGGLTATQTFGVAVGDRLAREVMTDMFAAMGRGYLSSARLTLGRRLERGVAGATRVRVAGQQMSPGAWERLGSASLEQSQELLFGAMTLRQSGPQTNVLGTSADPRLLRPESRSNLGGGFGGAGGGRDRLLLSTDVLVSFGGDETAPHGGRSWTLWGRGDLQSFRGVPGARSRYDGDLTTGYLGVDARLSERWLVGMALARSAGAGNWQVGSSSGKLTTGLTMVHPYARWSGDKTAVWALAGLGRGSSENVRALTGQRGTSPLHLGLGLVEARRRMATLVGGIALDLRAEASWARLQTGGGAETVDGLKADVRRLRTGLEATRPTPVRWGLTLAPFGAVSTRYDGGAGQTGTGLEFAGGLRLTGGKVRIEAQGRSLALHSAAEYRERGLSLLASLGAGRHQPGLSASLRPSWGAPGARADTLWRDRVGSYAAGLRPEQGAMDAQLGYGFRLPGGRLLSAFGGYGQTPSGRRLQVGAYLGTLGAFRGGFASPLQIEFLGERFDQPGGGTDHRFTLFGIVNFRGHTSRRCPVASPSCGAAASSAPGKSPPPKAAGVVKPAN